MIETSKALNDFYFRYTHLPLGGKEIVCPYWRNNLKQGISGPFGGKGRPEEIVEAAKSEAAACSLDLGRMFEEEIVAFMKKRKIGVDCSGFVFWMLDSLDQEIGGPGLLKRLPECSGSFPASRANVELLTGKAASSPVKSLKEIAIGDMIRLAAGQHVAIVLSLENDEKGRLWKISYAHSSSKTAIQGVHLGLILVDDSQKGLESQLWQEETDEGENYGQKEFLPSKGDGIRRLSL